MMRNRLFLIDNLAFADSSFGGTMHPVVFLDVIDLIIDSSIKDIKIN